MAKKVLVVDDEKLIVKGIRFSLEQDGMEVDCAYDGEEALKMATENHYDMILLDIMLPKMDGFEVCQHIREFSDMPIVMLTAKAMTWIRSLVWNTEQMITSQSRSISWKSKQESRQLCEELQEASRRKRIPRSLKRVIFVWIARAEDCLS